MSCIPPLTFPPFPFPSLRLLLRHCDRPAKRNVARLCFLSGPTTDGYYEGRRTEWVKDDFGLEHWFFFYLRGRIPQARMGTLESYGMLLFLLQGGFCYLLRA